jgi:uncharacterized sodium:solute symporter family permease YidK
MLSTLDYLTILISPVAVIFVALWASGSGDKSSDAGYFLAGRDLSWPFVENSHPTPNRKARQCPRAEYCRISLSMLLE